MKLRGLILLLIFAACSVWPSGVILCIGPEGHIEFELEGGDCCPEESDDCTDCADSKRPELTTSAGLTILPPAPVSDDTRADAPRIAPAPAGRPLSLAPLEALKSTVLLL